MISTVEKVYQILDDGTQSNTFLEQYKVTYNDNLIVFVPHDTDNRHYQEILEWVAEGNTITDNGGDE